MVLSISLNIPLLSKEVMVASYVTGDTEGQEILYSSTNPVFSAYTRHTQQIKNNKSKD